MYICQKITSKTIGTCKKANGINPLYSYSTPSLTLKMNEVFDYQNFNKLTENIN